MEMKPVKSSHIKAIGYDEATQTMRVQFRSGALYETSGVPPEAHADFVAADSPGGHWHKHFLKNPQYTFKRVEEEYNRAGRPALTWKIS